MSKIVKSVIFDAVIEGKEFKNVVLDFTPDDTKDYDDSVYYDYIHDEDGPWCAAECGGRLYDFQVFGDPERRKKLCIGCCEVVLEGTDSNGEPVYSVGDFVYDFEYSNIRVKCMDSKKSNN